MYETPRVNVKVKRYVYVISFTRVKQRAQTGKNYASVEIHLYTLKRSSQTYTIYKSLK